MRLKDSVVSVLVMVYFILETWYRIFISRLYLKKFKSGLDWYVIRSWFYLNTIDDEDEYNDKYFGWLPDFLNYKNINSIVIAGVFKDYRTIVKKIAKHEGHIILTPELFISYWSPFKSVWNVWNKGGYNGIDIITLLRSFQNKYSIEGLFARYKVDTFTTLHENLFWEMICLHTIKTISPSTKTIGYQHTPLSMGTFNKVEVTDPLPDKIITIGEVNRKFLVENGYDKKNVVVGGNLKFKLPKSKSMLPYNPGVKVMVALRGIPSVSSKMLSFISKASLTEHGYNVIIRHHPNYDSNLKPLDEDLKDKSVVVYDSSMVAVEALAYGVPVIHINLGVDNDPLFKCENLHWAIDEPIDLIGMIDRVHSLSDTEFYSQQSKAREFVESYVAEPTFERLEEFVNG